MLIGGKYIIALFSQDLLLIDTAHQCISIYGISFIFCAYNISYTTYYLSIKQTRIALWISVTRSFIFNTLCILLIPYLLGKNTIWSGIIAAEFIVTILTLIINRHYKAAQK